MPKGVRRKNPPKREGVLPLNSWLGVRRVGWTHPIKAVRPRAWAVRVLPICAPIPHFWLFWAGASKSSGATSVADNSYSAGGKEWPCRRETAPALCLCTIFLCVISHSEETISGDVRVRNVGSRKAFYEHTGSELSANTLSHEEGLRRSEPHNNTGRDSERATHIWPQCCVVVWLRSER